MCLFVDYPEADILGNFRLVLLIKEDKGVVTGITSVKEGPSYTWVSRIV